MSGRNFGLSKKELYSLYSVHWKTTTQIAELTGCSRDTVLRAIKKYEIPLHTERIKALSKQNLEKLYIGKKWSTIKIANHLSCDDESIRKALQRNSIPIRTKSEALSNRLLNPEHRAKLIENARKMNKGKFGELHPGWKNARHIDKNGYVIVRRGGKSVREHRWIMGQHLGRELKPYEEVHHKNKKKTDNSLSNLQVFVNPHKKADYESKPKE